MSLMRLLTSGKCLVGLESVESRYRMRSRHLLPKFGATKNPFAAPASPRPQFPAAEPSAPQPMTPEEVAAANLKETRRLPSASPAPSNAPVPAAEKTSRIARLFTWLGQQAVRLIPAGRRERKSEPKSAIPRFDQPPVQGELSLDNIKVKCNDLSDADVEVVPVRQVSKPDVRSTMRADGSLELAGSQSL
jgi:hypothetical protein